MGSWTFGVLYTFGLLNRVNPNISPTFFSLALVLFTIFLPIQSIGSSNYLQIELLSPPEVEVAPRQMLTTSVRLTNPTRELWTYRISAETPSGWQYFLMPETLELGPDDSSVVFVSVNIPADALAGDYGLTLTAFPEEIPSDSVSAEVSVSVISVMQLEVRTSGPDQPEATTGDNLVRSFTVSNVGNAPGPVAIEIESWPEWSWVVDPPDLELMLDPGQWSHIVVTIAIPEGLAQSLTHSLSVIVRSLDPAAEDVMSQARTTTRIIPQLLTGTVYATLAGNIQTLLAFTEGDDPAGLVSIGPLEGDLGDKKWASIGIRNLFLAGGTSGTFVHRRSMQAIYADDDLGYIRAGDLALDLESPLIRRSVAGRGAEVFVNIEQYELRLFYSRTRGSSRRENTGLQVGHRLGESGRVRLTALRESEPGISGEFQEERIVSTNIGIIAEYTPTEDLEITAEFGRSFADIPGPDSAWRLTGDFTSERFSANCEWLRAGSSYRGGWSDTEQRRLSLRWNPVGDLALWWRYYRSRNNIANDPGIEARFFRNSGFGMSWNIEDFGRLRLSHRTTNELDNILHEYDRVSQLTAFSFTQRWDDISATTALVYQTNDYRVTGMREEIRSLRIDLNTRLNDDMYLRLSYSFGRLSQDNNPESVNTSNFILGSQMRLNQDVGFSLNLQRHIGGFLGSRTDIYGVLTWEIVPDHNLRLLIRESRGTFGSDTEVALEYTQPMSIELGMFPLMGSVEGRLYMADDPVPGLPDTRIRVGDAEVITDEDGYFSFPALDPGRHHLMVDPAALGVGFTTLIDMPVVLNIEAGSTIELEIPVIETASVEGSVVMDIPAARGQPSSFWSMSELKVELRGEDGSEFRFTDFHGHFHFSDLKPGSYMVILLTEFLPQDHEILAPSSYELELAPGDSITDLDFTIRPVEEEIVVTFDVPDPEE